MSEKVSILIIDDNKGMRETLSDVLQEKGYLTETAKTGQEAIVKARKRFFNVALIDIKLPDVTGIEVLQTFREKHPSMMTIMVTGYANLKNAVESLNSGANAYVMKPIDPERLDLMIKEFLTRVMNKFVTSLEIPASLREKIPKPFLERVVTLKESTKRVYIALYSYRKPATALEIAAPLDLARAYVSMRLNQLELMGLVKRRKAGNKKLFEVAL
jgi:DNA-binding response OmpR family regulator